MSNQYGIPEEVEQRIRQRDKACVYCNKIMISPGAGNDRRDWATIEHLKDDGAAYWDEGLKESGLTICCFSCNASRGQNKLLTWFKTPYCLSKSINEKTVAESVRKYIAEYENNEING
jgi:hypothetical protein